MRTENLIGVLLKQHDISKESIVSSFRPGQVILGKVTKFFLNEIAEVQVGTQKMIAKLEAPLTAGIPYWFQVQSIKGQIHLKVIEQSTSPINREQTSSVQTLLKQLQLPQSEEYAETLKHFLKEQLPVTRELIYNATIALNGVRVDEEGLQAVKQLVLKGLPITKDILEATVASNKQEPLHLMLNKLQVLLTENPISATGERLQAFVEQLIRVEHDQAAAQSYSVKEGQEQFISWDDRADLIQHIKKLTTMIGYDYERQLDYLLKDNDQVKIDRQENLKSLLLSFIDESPPQLYKESAEQLLNKVTGLQLLSQETGYFHQYVLQVPLSLWNKRTDLTVQWNGRKKENGQIDSSYCRILFYLELEHINEVIVDLQIQNRILNVNIYNDTAGIKILAKPFVTSLKDQLKEINYHLSSVNFHHSKDQKKLEKQKNQHSIYESNYAHGVDIKI